MSTQYIPFTDKQKEQARQTNLVSLLISQGETVKRLDMKKKALLANPRFTDGIHL